MRTSTQKIKQICKCENCGNEAEMVVTCTLPDASVSADSKSAADHKPAHQKVKGSATCTHCGNEADMWVTFNQ